MVIRLLLGGFEITAAQQSPRERIFVIIEQFEAVLLAGGAGSRLRESTTELVKLVEPIAGRPMIDYSMAMLARAGCVRIHVALGMYADQVTEALAPWEQKMEIALYPGLGPDLGTWTAASMVLRETSIRQAMIVFPDTLGEGELRRLLTSKSSGEAVTVPVQPTMYPDESHFVDIDGERITELLGKGLNWRSSLTFHPYFWVSNPVPAFEPGLDVVNDWLPAVVRADHARAIRIDELFLDCGTPARLQRARKMAVQGWLARLKQFMP